MAFKDSCPTLAKVAADEPIFVLRAQDKLAADTVCYWICEAEAAGVDQEKLIEAQKCAIKMRAWPNHKIPD